MEFNRYVVLLLFCKLLAAIATSNMCKTSNTTCFCSAIMDQHEFQCPNEKSPKVILNIQSNALNMQCIDTVNWENEDLPLLEAEGVNHITTSNCWPPTNNFVEIIDTFGINVTEVLTFNIAVHFTNITLTINSFDGLHNLRKLTLHDSLIEYVAEDAFKPLNNLIELNLRNNNIHLKDDLFKHLRKLTFLELTNSNLPYLPNQLLQNLLELQTLHLWSNKLTTLNSDTFENLKNLKLLELSNNRLEQLPINIFYGLKNLKAISLSMNKLENIPELFFDKNAFLEFVSISKNPYLQFVPNNLFSNFTKLKTVLLNDCKLSYLPINLFDGSVHITDIALQRNEIELLPARLFNDLVELQNLDLSYNKIKSLSNEVFASLGRLKTLNLENNMLTHIKKGLFQSLQHLELLNLRSNKISFIDTHAFQKTVNLNEIILADNNLNISMGRILSNNFNLEKIDLSKNSISAFDDFFILQVGLRQLDLSYNQLTYLKFSNLMTVSFPIKINLKHNNISTVNFDYAEIIARSQGHYDQYPSKDVDREVYLDGNPIHCDCNLYNFARYLDGKIDPMIPNLVKVILGNLSCTSPDDFIGVPVKALTANVLTCPVEHLNIEVNCPAKCSCVYRPYDKCLMVNCMKANITEVPKLNLSMQNGFNKVEVYLQGNLLTSGPEENMGYDNVTKLSLSYNNINEITWVPPKIEELLLDNNNIDHLNGNMLEMLPLLTSLTLGNNPFNCDCSVENLREYVVSRLVTKTVQIDINNVQCKDGKVFLAFNNDYCPPYKDILIGFTIPLLLVVFGFAVLIIFWIKGKKNTILFKKKMVAAKN